MKIISIVGARPNFMKVTPIILEIYKHNKSITNDKNIIIHKLVHTGQHYDKNLSDIFFKQLKLPQPDIYLNVGSGSHAFQTAEIMKLFEKVLEEEKPDLVITVGDVNSTIACALVASKYYYSKVNENNNIRPYIAHVEAGLRSFDRQMPEEINRIITDNLSDLLFVTEKTGIDNLLREGISKDKIHFVGNTMIDTLLTFKERANESDILERLNLTSHDRNNLREYSLLTLHRPSNVDEEKSFKEIIEALRELSQYMPMIFPIHPRTSNSIEKFKLKSLFHYFKDNSIKISEINIIPPLGYIDFLCLMMNARIVLTDSGGIQEETTCLNVPCITLRNNTERPITIEEGTNILAGCKGEDILNAFNTQLNKNYKNSSPKYWDGKTAGRIVKVIIDFFKRKP